MMKGIFECGEIRNLCLECQKAINAQGKSCAFRSLSNEYCQEVINADNALAMLKKTIIDHKTESMHEKIKNQFK